MTDDAVQAQYEAHPYPARDPRDEAKRLITGSPSHILELNHYVFAGRRDFRKPFRALVAGGGTGDGAIMLAQHLADIQSPGEVVYVDISTAARRVAEARAKARKLANIQFHTMALGDVATLGAFDYIDCCGVLHHLDDPAVGLRSLASVLAPGGGMGLMVYGELGRTGVYPTQDLLRLIGRGLDGADKLGLARRLTGALPSTNWLARNPFIRDWIAGGDAGLVDLLLHSRDRAYRVPELAALVGSAGLRIVQLIEPAGYDPTNYVTDPQLKKRFETLDTVERWSAAELLAGNMAKHVAYVVKADAPDSVAALDAPDAVPAWRDLDAEAFAKSHRRGEPLRAAIDGAAFRFALPPLAAAMATRIDGRRSLGDIHSDLLKSNPALDWAAFAAQYAVLHRALNGVGKLYLTTLAV